MRVSFACTQADIVDANMRMLARSKTIRNSNWKAIIASAVMLGPLMFLSLQALIGFLPFSIFGGLTGVLIAFALGPPFIDRSRRKNLARFVKEKYGDENSFPYEVELGEKGVAITGKNSQVVFPWEEVEEIVDTSDSVDIFTRNGSGIVVRNRAFLSPETRTQFIELAQRHLAQSITK
jgi:YcxB-like protein